ncbi:hypothetical protein JCGZ_22777 [Jatropha curcas]|uniref:Uncharacterized protein n=1 Tax=Jatropha curcas TaxID=180498 RepID=A0A067LFH2_JATCU|nr:hypothetical protein JCGZ_22777 [Jatropha curcas]
MILFCYDCQLLKDRFVGHLQPGQYITLHMDGLAAMKVLVSEGETKRKFLDEGWKEVVDYVLTIEGARWPKFYYYPGANYKLVFAVDDLNPLTLGRPIQNNQDKEDGIQDLPTGFAVTVKDMTIKHHTVMVGSLNSLLTFITLMKFKCLVVSRLKFK